MFITKTKTSIATKRKDSFVDYIKQLEEAIIKQRKHITDLEDHNTQHIKRIKELEDINNSLKERIRNLKVLNKDLLELLSQAGANPPIVKTDKVEKNSPSMEIQVKLEEIIKEKKELVNQLGNFKNQNETLRKLLKAYKTEALSEQKLPAKKEPNTEYIVKISPSKFYLVIEDVTEKKQSNSPIRKRLNIRYQLYQVVECISYCNVYKELFTSIIK